MDAESLMFAAYLVAMYRDVANAPLLWKAKTADFDAYCFFESQLVVSGGLAQTIEYLQTLPDESAAQAVEYLKEPWNVSSPEAEIEEYFRDNNQPWYI